MTSDGKNKIRFGILLTSTIRPNITLFSKRNDLKTRESDYCDALSVFVKTNYPIVFCDSSDFSLDNIRKILSPRAPKTYEVLQFNGGTFPSCLGKGYGELQIIKHAMNHSKILKHCDFVVKITGRYSVQNLSEILDSIQVNDNTIVIADYNKLSSYVYSGLFIAKPSFFFDHLFSYQKFINDSEKRFFEHALLRAIQDAVNSGNDVHRFPVRPIIKGYSGTWNVRLSERGLNEIEMSFTKLRFIVFGYYGALKSRINKLLY